jgi:serine/threonine protein kinase
LVVDDFRLEALIASGGMGQVWKAIQVSLQRPVAIKFMREDRLSERSVAFFGREARAGGRMNHPGLVTVYAAGQAGELHWIAQEFVVGGATLRDFIDDARRSPRPAEDYYRSLAGFLIELCDAMQFAHDAGVIHRDLKPNNILVTPDDRPKITDFGLARLTDEASISELFSLQGTPFYMSPEQVMGKIGGIDHRADIFSLGAVIYEALTLRKAFDADTQPALFLQILREDPDDPRTIDARIPDELAIVCMRALEKRRRDRFASMREMGEELRRYQRGEPLLTHPPGAWQRATKWVVRRQSTSVALGLGLALVGLGGWSLSKIQSARVEARDQKKENLVIQADYAIDDARMDEVERLMAEYGRLDADDYLPQLVLARGYSQHLRYAEAEREFEAARTKGFDPDRVDPADAQSLYQRALALVIAGDLAQRPEAIRCLEAAVELNPRLRAAQLMLYQLHKEDGDLAAADQALAAFQGHLATGDDYYQVVAALRSEMQGRTQEAVDRMLELGQRVGSERARDLRVDRILGRLYLQLAFEAPREQAQAGEALLSKAEQHLSAAVDVNPSDVSSWVNRGMAQIRWYWHASEGPQAAEHLALALRFGRQALSLHPKSAPALRVVLNALVFTAKLDFDPRSGDLSAWNEAASVAKELRVLDPEHPSLDLMEGQIDYFMGVAAEAHQDSARARELYSRSLEHDPNQVVPRLWLAQQDFLAKDFQASFKHLQAAQGTLADHAQEDAIGRLRPEFRVVLNIWSFGAGCRLGADSALDLARSAREQIDAALLEGVEVDPVELLNYAEFLATSPVVELRDCEEARFVFEQFDLRSRLNDPRYLQSLRDVEALIENCR